MEVDNIKILALDQATLLGFAVFEDSKLIYYGLADFKKYKEHPQRISEIKSTLNELIDRYQPDIIGLEDVQLQSNPSTFKLLSKLLGVLENNLYEQDYNYKIIKSSEWRKACGVKGRKREEQKKNAQLIVKKLFDLDVTEDEADAILLGWSIVKSLKLNK